jgi:hypothetical protein
MAEGVYVNERTSQKLTKGCTFLVSILLLVAMDSRPAWSETPAPSVHWGSLAFPDQYSTFTSGLTLDRFTPTDGNGAKYDSTVANTIGFNLITFSWTQHWGKIFDVDGLSTNLTVGISPTGNQPSEYFQNKVVHQLRHLPPVPTEDPRKETDAMIDGSVTKWFPFPLVDPNLKTVFVGGGFSVGTVYQQGFLRGGIRRLQISPTFYSGCWGDVSVRGSALGRISYQTNGPALHSVRNTAGLVQPSIAFGQYRRTETGETIPTWEIEFGLMWDSGIFVNPAGESQKQFAWSLALSGGPLRFETWNDSMGNIATRDFGPTYGASVTLDLLRVWRYMQPPISEASMPSHAS